MLISDVTAREVRKHHAQYSIYLFFFFQAEDGIRCLYVTGVQTCALPIAMGGAVVDRAFDDGLSAKDGVRTYIAIAAPHSGADFARVPTAVLPLIGPVRDIVRAGATLVARDPESAAARDLATARPIAPPQGVVRLDLSLSTDGFVNRYDAIDPGVDQRVFLPASPGEFLDGHGGSLTH